MEQFRLEVADEHGKGYVFNVKSLGDEQYSIYNDANERLGSIEIDEEDPEFCRQTLDCQIRLPLLNAIRSGILMHEELVLH